METLWKHLEKMSEGAANKAKVDHKTSQITVEHEVKVNRTGGAVVQKHLEYLGPITYTEEEDLFAKGIQEATGNKQVCIVAAIPPLNPTEKIRG